MSTGHTGRDADGFLCHECGHIFQMMWGDTCNGCRAIERRHQELLAAIKEHRTDETPNVSGSTP